MSSIIMGYYGSILSHNYKLCLRPSGPPTLYILKRLALREYCSFCIQPVLVGLGPTHPKKIKKTITLRVPGHIPSGHFYDAIAARVSEGSR